MTTDKIIAAAREADPGFDGGPDADGTMTDSLVGIKAIERFYAIAYRAGMERAAEICETEWDSDYGKQYGEIYAETIRAEAHAKNQTDGRATNG